MCEPKFMFIFQVIPRAVLFYTGEAADEDEFYGDDEEEEDDGSDGADEGMDHSADASDADEEE